MMTGKETIELKEFLQTQINIFCKQHEKEWIEVKGALTKAEATLKEELTKAENRVDERFKVYRETQEATAKVLDERLARMNEFRDQINSERQDYVTHKELNLIMEPYKEHRYYQSGEKEATRDTKGSVVTIIAIIIAVVSLIINFI